MKKLIPPMIIGLFLIVIVILLVSMAKGSQPITIVTGNTAFKPLPIELNRTNDTQCAMLIRTERNAAQAIAPDGRTWFFDDPGCLVLWLEQRPFRDTARLWVHTIDTHRWIDARKAHYGITDKTEMHYGFGAREKATESTIDYATMRLRMLRGENLTDPKIRKKLLGH